MLGKIMAAAMYQQLHDTMMPRLMDEVNKVTKPQFVVVCVEEKHDE